MDSSSILQDQVESCPLLSSNFWHFVQIFACVPYHLIHPFCFGSKSKMKMIRVQFFRFSNQKSKCQLTVQNESRSACQPCIGPGWGAYGVSAGPPKLVELGSSSVQMSSSQTGSLSFLSKLLKYSVLTQHILKSADSARYWHEIKTYQTRRIFFNGLKALVSSLFSLVHLVALFIFRRNAASTLCRRFGRGSAIITKKKTILGIIKLWIHDDGGNNEFRLAKIRNEDWSCYVLEHRSWNYVWRM